MNITVRDLLSEKREIRLSLQSPLNPDTVILGVFPTLAEAAFFPSEMMILCGENKQARWIFADVYWGEIVKKDAFFVVFEKERSKK